MKTLFKLILLLAAVISYGYGFSQGVVILVVLGIALELTFWFGIFGKSTKTSSIHKIK